METYGTKDQAQPISPGHHLLESTVLVLLAEILLPLTGIVTAAFLTRSLGASDYGLLTLSATLIYWIELIISSLFARATVKIIGDSDDWKPIATSVLRLHVFVSIGAFAVCCALAKPFAALLGEPGLATYFTLFALDIPIFGLAHCHRSILIGRGKYTERARMGAGRWIARLVLVIVLVELGLSLSGAILGMIGATMVELAIARYFVRPTWSGRVAVPPSLWGYAVPIFVAALILRFFDMGLLLLKMLGASAAQAGVYGAAQNLAFVMPGLFAASFSPLLLSTITRVLREGNIPAATTLGRNALRAVIAFLPLAVVAAVSSNEIAVLLFGIQFAGAGPLISILIFAGFSLMIINLVSAILIAFAKPAWTLKLVAPLLPIAIVCHFLAIPRFGSIGAASVTACVTGFGALCAVIIGWKLLKIDLPVSTILRTVLISGTAYALVPLWPVTGLAVVLKIAVALVCISGGYFLLGEFQHNEITFLWSSIRRPRSGKPAIKA